MYNKPVDQDICHVFVGRRLMKTFSRNIKCKSSDVDAGGGCSCYRRHLHCHRVGEKVTDDDNDYSNDTMKTTVTPHD